MKKRLWTQEEIESLKKGIIPLNRSKNSIKVMRVRLGLVSKKVPRWTKNHKETLIQLLNEGKSQEEISKLLPYSRRGIQKQIARMGLQEKRQYKFTKKELEKFTQFLKDNWEQKTPQELTEIWNKNNSKKIGRNKVNYHLAKLKIKIPKRESLRMGFLKKKEKKIYENCKTTRESADKIKQLRVELMRKRIEENKDLWTGLPGYNLFDWDESD